MNTTTNANLFSRLFDGLDDPKRLAFTFARYKFAAKMLARIPLGRWAEPEEIAPVFVFLASDESRFVTGVQLKIDAGIGGAAAAAETKLPAIKDVRTLEELKAAKGSVVNVTSIAGSRVHPFAGTAYSTSKAALAALTAALALLQAMTSSLTPCPTRWSRHSRAYSRTSPMGLEP